MSEDKELQEFTKWLLDHKETRGEDIEDEDYYAIGIHAVWLYENERSENDEKGKIDRESLKQWLETALNNEDWLYKYTGKHPRDELFGGLQLVLDLIKEGELPQIDKKESHVREHKKIKLEFMEIEKETLAILKDKGLIEVGYNPEGAWEHHLCTGMHYHRPKGMVISDTCLSCPHRDQTDCNLCSDGDSLSCMPLLKKLYEQLDSSEISVFDNARRTVIREMEAIKDIDAESCVVYLVDAVSEITTMQKFALLNTEINISDIVPEVKKMDEKK